MIWIASRVAKFSPILALVYLVVLIYALLYPFEFSSPNSSEFFFSFRTDAEGRLTAGTNWTNRDLINNVVLFVPFGVFVFAWLGRHSKSWVLSILITAVAAGLVSASCETLQLFLTTRESSISDLGTNVIGAIAGAAGCWFWFLQAGELQRIRKVSY